MSNVDANKNCHEYCRYGKYCRHCDGNNGMDPEGCAMFYKIDDLMFDASEQAKEDRIRREKEFEECDDW